MTRGLFDFAFEKLLLLLAYATLSIVARKERHLDPETMWLAKSFLKMSDDPQAAEVDFAGAYSAIQRKLSEITSAGGEIYWPAPRDTPASLKTTYRIGGAVLCTLDNRSPADTERFIKELDARYGMEAKTFLISTI